MSSSSAPAPPAKDFERLRPSASPSPIADRFIQQGQQGCERRASAGTKPEPAQTHVPVHMHTRHLGPKQHVLAHGRRMNGSHRTGSQPSTGIAHGGTHADSQTQPLMRTGAPEGVSRSPGRSHAREDARLLTDGLNQTHGRQSVHIHPSQPAPSVLSESANTPALLHSAIGDPGRHSSPSTEEKDRSIDGAEHDSKSPLMSRLKRHFVSRSPLTSTWEKKSFVEECRSAPPLLEHERPGIGGRSAGDAEGDNLEMMEQGVPRGRRSESSHSRPTSLYASPAALRAFNPLPQVQMLGQSSARAPLSGVHQNVPPVPAASTSGRGVSGSTHGPADGAHSHTHHSDGRARHGGHDDHSKCRECDAIWNSAV